ncbi:MAG: inositol monophosphatase [Chloroflexota bacterium]
MTSTEADRAQLREWELAAAEIVRAAGALLRERFFMPLEVEFKDDKKIDPVTALDRAVQAQVFGELARRYPEHTLLGEEDAEAARAGELTWVLDPLDGTTNFAGRLPFFGVSLALLRNGVPIVAALYVPFGPTFSDGVIHCSFGNGVKIDGVDWRLDHKDLAKIDCAALPLGRMSPFQVRGELAKWPGNIRNFGSIVYELVMVAGGGLRFAGFFAPKLWDVAGGMLVVREAGGSAMVWRRGAWRHLDAFTSPLPTKAKPNPTLRDWVAPVLVVGPGAFDPVVNGLNPRRPPNVLLRWWWKGMRSVRRAFRRSKSATPTQADPKAPPTPKAQ